MMIKKGYCKCIQDLPVGAGSGSSFRGMISASAPAVFPRLCWTRLEAFSGDGSDASSFETPGPCLFFWSSFASPAPAPSPHFLGEPLVVEAVSFTNGEAGTEDVVEEGRLDAGVVVG